MIRQYLCTVVVLSFICMNATAAIKKPGDVEATGEKKKKRVPAGWLRGSGPGGYEKALKLQEETGLDMLVLFYRNKPSNEKGLLRWFEKKGMNHSGVIKQMRKYVKVRLDASRNDKRTRALIKEYHVGKTPRLVIRQSNGWTRRVRVFDWPGGKPKLADHQEIIKRLKEGSSPSYREEE